MGDERSECSHLPSHAMTAAIYYLPAARPELRTTHIYIDPASHQHQPLDPPIAIAHTHIRIS
jgi:hypothetical protein